MLTPNAPAIEAGKDYLLFDGDCGICSAASTWAGQLDHRQRFVIQPYQTYAEIELARFGLSYAVCDRKVQVITRRGRVYAGAFAVNYYLWHQFPWTLLVLLIYALPVLLLGEVLGYALVARHRRRLSQWFGLRACLLKRDDSPPKTRS
jgi:predicted DCC family thiol-disulfide oxidoreductase YuxK